MRAVELRLLFESDAEIEPGVRKLRVELLGLLQLRDAACHVAGAE